MTDDQAPDNGTEVPHHPSDEVEPGWPWSFILLVVAGAAYLVFRFIDFVAEIIN